MATEMNYEQRLIAAARLADNLNTTTAKEFDIPSAEEVAEKCSEWGVTAQLKAHQAQGLSWLIHRYAIGVNVILDGTWENIAGYKFVGLLERSTEMPRAIFGVVSIKRNGWLGN